MLKSVMKVICVAAITSLASLTNAGSWTLDGEASKLSFGSVKKDKIGESHSFEKISGSVMADGTVSVAIDLTSVQTNIDIRNERMMEHVFKGMASANLSTNLDMAELEGLAVGANTVVDAEVAVSLVGASGTIDAELFVVRISDTQVMVTTNDIVFLSTDDMGLTAGIDKLMELAKLPSITRSSPVSLRFIFNADKQKAEAAPAAPATLAISGDVKKGKKVFKKCKACHSLKAAKNGVGPSLHMVIGSTAGTTEGYKYSQVIKSSGVVWTVENLGAFLTNPSAFIPGNKMSYKGLKKEKDITNILAYIDSVSK